jgi:hypothetical protein
MGSKKRKQRERNNNGIEEKKNQALPFSRMHSRANFFSSGANFARTATTRGWYSPSIGFQLQQRENEKRREEKRREKIDRREIEIAEIAEIVEIAETVDSRDSL